MRRRDVVIETEVKWKGIHLIHLLQYSVRVCSPADMRFLLPAGLEIVQSCYFVYHVTKTCLLIKTEGLHLPFHNAEIRISRSNWDFYCWFLLWRVVRLLAVAMILMLSLQQWRQQYQHRDTLGGGKLKSCL